MKHRWKAIAAIASVCMALSTAPAFATPTSSISADTSTPSSAEEFSAALHALAGASAAIDESESSTSSSARTDDAVDTQAEGSTDNTPDTAGDDGTTGAKADTDTQDSAGASESVSAAEASGEGNDTSPDGVSQSEPAVKNSPAASSDPRTPKPLTNEQLSDPYQWDLNNVSDTSGQRVFRSTGNYSWALPALRSGGTSTGNVPNGLSKYYSQRLIITEKEDCDYQYTHQCAKSGYFLVPIDYSNPSLGDVAIYFSMLYPSSGMKGVYFLNNGGPGGSGARWVSSWHHSYFGTDAFRDLDFLEDYGLVGIDPRGTNSSFPRIQCQQPPGYEYKTVDPLPSPSEYDPNAGTQASVDNTYRYASACREYTGQVFGWSKAQKNAFIDNVGTTTAVKDYDVARSLFAQEKMNFIGLSYGTRVGYEYARQFPGNVGRFLLDGVLSPLKDHAPSPEEKTPNLTEDQIREKNQHGINQGIGFQRAFEEYAKWCYQQSSCPLSDPRVQPKPGDLADDDSSLSLATRQVQNILRPLLMNPLSTKYQRKPEDPYIGGMDGPGDLGFYEASVALRGGLYDPSNWERISQGLQAIIDRNQSTYALPSFYRLQEYYGTGDRSTFLTISCADSANPSSASVENDRKAALMYYHAAPFVDPGYPYNQAAGIDTCDAWAHDGNLAAGTPLANLPEMLITSATEDPATIYENGAELAALVKGVFLTVKAAQHVIFGGIWNGPDGDQDNPLMCAAKIYSDYLRYGLLPQAGFVDGVCSVSTYRPSVDMTWVVRDEDIAVGAAPSDGQYTTGKYEYRWMSYNLTTQEWAVISDWSTSNWSAWAQDKGTYWLHLAMRDATTKTELATKTIAFAHTPGRHTITGTYAGPRNGEVLLGSSTDNPRGKLVTKIYDVQAGTWVAQYKGAWNIWRPRPGIYWTHYELYTSTGHLQDVKTYAFQMH